MSPWDALVPTQPETLKSLESRGPRPLPAPQKIQEPAGRLPAPLQEALHLQGLSSLTPDPPESWGPGTQSRLFAVNEIITKHRLQEEQGCFLEHHLPAGYLVARLVVPTV